MILEERVVGTRELTRLGCGQQVEKAQEAEQKIDQELKDLQATLANIEEARPFDQLTVSGQKRDSGRAFFYHSVH